MAMAKSGYCGHSFTLPNLQRTTKTIPTIRLGNNCPLVWQPGPRQPATIAEEEFKVYHLQEDARNEMKRFDRDERFIHKCNFFFFGRFESRRLGGGHMLK